MVFPSVDSVISLLFLVHGPVDALAVAYRYSFCMLLWWCAVQARTYEAHAPHGSTTCVGTACFRNTFYIAAALCATGAVASAWLCYRTPIRRPRRSTRTADIF